MSRVIMFCFGGRRPNLELQLPFIFRILDRFPQVEYHLWNLAKTPEDTKFIKDMAWSMDDRFKVVGKYAGTRNPWEHFNDVYRHYATSDYRDCTFIKLDDDVVFLETDRFGQFLAAVEQHPDSVVSAKVVNNGACGRHFPEIDHQQRRSRKPLLDVHKDPAYARMCHHDFLEAWDSYVGEELRDIPTQDWLSINVIGYNWAMARTIADLLGTKHPRYVAGRQFLKPHMKLGDEGLVNTLPRVIFQGFTACHLTFGPQERAIPPAEWTDLRKQYAEVGKEYLGG